MNRYTFTSTYITDAENEEKAYANLALWLTGDVDDPNGLCDLFNLYEGDMNKDMADSLQHLDEQLQALRQENELLHAQLTDISRNNYDDSVWDEERAADTFKDES